MRLPGWAAIKIVISNISASSALDQTSLMQKSLLLFSTISILCFFVHFHSTFSEQERCGLLLLLFGNEGMVLLIIKIPFNFSTLLFITYWNISNTENYKWVLLGHWKSKNVILKLHPEKPHETLKNFFKKL